MKEPFRLPKRWNTEEERLIWEDERSREEDEELGWREGVAKARSSAELKSVIARAQTTPLRRLYIYADLKYNFEEDDLHLHPDELLPELADLKDLEALSLHGEFLSLAPLAGLSGLKSLEISGMRGADLTPLSGLTQLTSLDLSGFEYVDLAPLSGLAQLTLLDLSGLRLVDLAPLSGLTQLTSLDLDGCEVFPEDLKHLRPLMRKLIEGARWEGGGLQFGVTRAVESDAELARISRLSAFPRMLELQKHLFPEDVAEAAKPFLSPSASEPPRSPALISLNRAVAGAPRLEARPNPPSNGRTSPNPQRLEGLLRQAQSLCKTLVAFGQGMNAGPGFIAALEGYREEAGVGAEKVLPDTLELHLDLAFTALDLRQDHPDSAVVRAKLAEFRDGSHSELMAQHFPAMAEQEAAADASALPPELPVLEEVENFAKALREGATDGVSPQNLARYAAGARDAIEAEDSSPETLKGKKRALYGLSGVATQILKAVGVGSLATAVTLLADLKTLGALEPIVRAALALWRVVKPYFGF